MQDVGDRSRAAPLFKSTADIGGFGRYSCMYGSITASPTLSTIAKIDTVMLNDDNDFVTRDILGPSFSRYSESEPYYCPSQEPAGRALSPDSVECHSSSMPPPRLAETALPLFDQASDVGGRFSGWDSSRDPFVVVEPSPAIRRSRCLPPPSDAACSEYVQEEHDADALSASTVSRDYHYSYYGGN